MNHYDQTVIQQKSAGDLLEGEPHGAELGVEAGEVVPLPGAHGGGRLLLLLVSAVRGADLALNSLLRHRSCSQSASTINLQTLASSEIV